MDKANPAKSEDDRDLEGQGNKSLSSNVVADDSELGRKKAE